MSNLLKGENKSVLKIPFEDRYALVKLPVSTLSFVQRINAYFYV